MSIPNGDESIKLGKEFSLALIMFHQTVAEKAGLNLTDYKVLGIIPFEGITAGDIAKITGLSTGMVTTVADSLEEKNFVYRERDPKDRRKVIIKANFEKVVSELGPYFQSFGQEMAKVTARYSPEEYEIIKDYLQKALMFSNGKWRKSKGNKGGDVDKPGFYQRRMAFKKWGSTAI